MYFLCCFIYFCVLYIVCFLSFSVLFVCICVLNYCHRVATQLQLNISYFVQKVKAIRLLQKVRYKSPAYAAHHLRSLVSTHQSVPIQPNIELLRTSGNSAFKAVAL
jgi:hypothetical protein